MLNLIRKLVTTTHSVPKAANTGNRRPTTNPPLRKGAIISFAWEGWWAEEVPTID